MPCATRTSSAFPAAVRPSGSARVSSRPIREARPRRRARTIVAQVDRSSPCRSTRAPGSARRTPSTSTGATVSASAGGMSCTSTSTRRQRRRIGEAAHARRPRSCQMPASTPTPRSSRAAATSSAPSSCQFTEAKSGSSRHRRTAWSRSAARGAVQAPVVTPTGVPGHRSRTARTHRSTCGARRLSLPCSSLGWRWIAFAPAATASAHSAATSSGES